LINAAFRLSISFRVFSSTRRLSSIASCCR
jgi:hypothetical protein